MQMYQLPDKPKTIGFKLWNLCLIYTEMWRVQLYVMYDQLFYMFIR